MILFSRYLLPKSFAALAKESGKLGGRDSEGHRLSVSFVLTETSMLLYCILARFVAYENYYCSANIDGSLFVTELLGECT